MAVSRKKYRRATELYVRGTEVELLGEDGPVYVWMQVLNPFERDEATHDAQVARSRIVMALKNGEERDKVVASFWEDGREVAASRLADVKTQEKLPDTVEAIANDKEWVERIDIMNRSEDLMARPVLDEERVLLQKINEEYIDEVNARQEKEFAYLVERYSRLSVEDLIEEYCEAWLVRRGADVAGAEYQLTEVWYAARACDGICVDGVWNHSNCENHRTTAFETKAEVRDLPEDLQVILFDAMQNLNMSAREARFLASQASSSDSSPQPSEEAESTPSTPTETPVSALGT